MLHEHRENHQHLEKPFTHSNSGIQISGKIDVGYSGRKSAEGQVQKKPLRVFLMTNALEGRGHGWVYCSNFSRQIFAEQTTSGREETVYTIVVVFLKRAGLVGIARPPSCL